MLLDDSPCTFCPKKMLRLYDGPCAWLRGEPLCEKHWKQARHLQPIEAEKESA